MKKLLILFLFLTGVNNANTQIDISADASYLGVYTNLKVSYPIYDMIVVGGSVGYNVSNYYLSERYDAVIGVFCNQWTQVELDLGFISGFNEFDIEKRMNKQYIFHADLGIKMHFLNNLFWTIQVAYPGFAKVGLGVRLRPYNKLTVWDKQDL